MADEYISREAAKVKIREKFKTLKDRIEINEVLNAIPAADVQPVRHGRWIEENRRPKSGMFYCSECHRTAYDPQPTRLSGWTKRCRYAYCPNCGARMDGGEE